MGGHGRVNSFNWYTLQNPLTPVDATIPSDFFYSVSEDPPKHCDSTLPRKRLDKGQLSGSDVEGIDVRGQTGVSLLLAVRAVSEC